jgi:metal-responsive CopG/Arc/MetJ family transcriptional regulator
MAHAKVAISLSEQLLLRLDRLVREEVFASRSQAIQEAVLEKLDRLSSGRLARECARLDPEFEQRLAEEGLSGDAESWPEY